MNGAWRILMIVLVFSLYGLTSANAADSPSDAARRAELYHVAAGKTYNMHANDHARMLGKYAAAGSGNVPNEVIREHAVAIRTNVARAQQSYDKLAKAAANSPEVLKQLAEVQKRLAAVTKQVAQLEAAQATDAQTVKTATTAISADLKATHDVSKEIDAALNQVEQSEAENDNFENRQSDDYYFTGEGHFLD